MGHFKSKHPHRICNGLRIIVPEKAYETVEIGGRRAEFDLAKRQILGLAGHPRTQHKHK